MTTLGLDIGSRTIKLVVWENGAIVLARKALTSYDPLAVCRELLGDAPEGPVMATGYGRHLLKEYLRCETVSEIKAFALGARAVCPSCRTILDIGGQDTKAISLAKDGRIDNFHLNDKCAAGTGRFLEIMAVALGLSLGDFMADALSAEAPHPINSMCTVFAESEVISTIAGGAPRPAIALGIHRAIAARAVSLLERVTVAEDIVFAGGVALNSCMQQEIEKALGRRIHVPVDPQIIGALGCALLAAKNG
ncbi:MAG: 3-hydroxyacyl-ACP dehydratase [Deltaproteobacteria bacterium HGW-Deltaproteobacteria-9]|nr:MAG: 3-hydroxyacyl-ACP dehydratase [Deltaproteobacteria bacterium HGW-Deltaproteobacteria-9]